MKVLGICGSPREKSNSREFLAYTLRQIEVNGLDTELVKLRDLNIAPCVGCYQCIENKGCVIKDDFQGLFKKLLESEGLLLASPVYHGSITAQLKAFLDRAGFSARWIANDMQADYKWSGTPFSKKVGAPITVARRAGFSSAFSQLLLWFTVNDFYVSGSHYWNVGVAGKGGAVDAAEDEEGLNILEHLADNVSYLIKKLNC